MRYITIPKPTTVGAQAYGLRDHNLGVVAGHPDCRSSAEKLDLIESVLDKFEAAGYAPGTVVELTDREHEAYEPLASMKGQQLAGEAARAVNKIARAVLAATTTDPRL